MLDIFALAKDNLNEKFLVVVDASKKPIVQVIVLKVPIDMAQDTAKKIQEIFSDNDQVIAVNDWLKTQQFEVFKRVSLNLAPTWNL